MNKVWEDLVMAVDDTVLYKWNLLRLNLSVLTIQWISELFFKYKKFLNLSSHFQKVVKRQN